MATIMDPKVKKSLNKTDNQFMGICAVAGAFMGVSLGIFGYFVCKSAVKQGRLEYDVALNVANGGACAAKNGES